MQVVDGRKHFRGSLEETLRGPGFARLAERVGVKVKPITEVANAPPLTARVNHNRWIADCPDCGGAEYVWLENPLFMCAGCWNSNIGGKWRRVTVPANHAQIEAVLRARPVPQSRNWEPGESLNELKRQNKERGLPETA